MTTVDAAAETGPDWTEDGVATWHVGPSVGRVDMDSDGSVHIGALGAVDSDDVRRLRDVLSVVLDCGARTVATTPPSR